MKRNPFLIIAATALFAACATTKPVQKSNLAKDKAGKNGAGAAEGAPTSRPCLSTTTARSCPTTLSPC